MTSRAEPRRPYPTAARTAPAVLASAMLASACHGTVGTIELELKTAPGSTVLDAVDLLRVRLTHPPTTIEATRGAGGFQLALEVEASAIAGSLIVDGFDASGGLIATGMSPSFAVASINATIAIYMAFPMTIDRAPVTLLPARDEVAVARLAYGVVLAGGRDRVAGTVTDAIAIYNAYDHTLAAGLPMPAARTGLELGTGTGSSVYLFGGRDAAGSASGTLWRFDTTTAPAGGFVELDDQIGFARADQAMVAIGPERYLITGAPVLELATGALRARTEVAGLGPTGVSVVGTDGVTTGVFADGAGITTFRNDAFTVIDPTPQADAAIVALPDRSALVIAGGELRHIDPIAGVVTATAGVATACARPEATATSRHVVIACPTETVVLDAVTRELVGRIATGGVAPIALPNEQVLLLRDGELVLFTPPSPE